MPDPMAAMALGIGNGEKGEKCMHVLIVGAGPTGTTLAHQLKKKNHRITVMESSHQIGGAAADRFEPGLGWQQLYGPHIFHTDSERVWNFLKPFATWLPYVHRVGAEIDGILTSLPINFSSIEDLFPGVLAEKYIRLLLDRFNYGSQVSIDNLEKTCELRLVELALYVRQNVFDFYSFRQWGEAYKELMPVFEKRVPIRISRDNRYFRDRFQVMPKDGFTSLFGEILDGSYDDLQLGIRADALVAKEFDHVFWTGGIDAFFGHKLGKLPYVAVELDIHVLSGLSDYAVVNYPQINPWSRSTEFRHLYNGQSSLTCFERHLPYDRLNPRLEPAYPIPTEANKALYKAYADEAARLTHNVTFCGRLGRYQYWDIHQAIAHALHLADEFPEA
jgi:UDP-galactopyranose mutase